MLKRGMYQYLMRKVKPKDKRNKIKAKNNKITNIVPCCRISAGIVIIFSLFTPLFGLQCSDFDYF